MRTIYTTDSPAVLNRRRTLLIGDVNFNVLNSYLYYGFIISRLRWHKRYLEAPCTQLRPLLKNDVSTDGYVTQCPCRVCAHTDWINKYIYARFGYCVFMQFDRVRVHFTSTLKGTGNYW